MDEDNVFVTIYHNAGDGQRKAISGNIDNITVFLNYPPNDRSSFKIENNHFALCDKLHTILVSSGLKYEFVLDYDSSFALYRLKFNSVSDAIMAKLLLS